ncbi:MAG: preprotein translocase subunit SecA, partial [Patescibacteria group bacterium]|nr:preprotein translocase subunit SecA [Patescibacteria group bacterium]
MKLPTFLFDPTKDLKKQAAHISSFESDIAALDDAGLKRKSAELKSRVAGGASLDDVLPEAFALVRETAKRSLGQRHFDVQLMGGIALHQGKIAEMATGEGKTLSSTSPIYLNALSGKGVHVITVNEYLAKRDAVWMGQIHHFLGMKVACLVHDSALMYDPEYISKNAEKLVDAERDTTGSFRIQEEYLRPVSRREAYEADITYGTNHEFGFDYLRDNLVYVRGQQVQSRGRHFAIIDEIDSILIDEARTPLIISAPDTESSEYYKTFSRLAATLTREEDYTVDEKF